MYLHNSTMFSLVFQTADFLLPRLISANFGYRTRHLPLRWRKSIRRRQCVEVNSQKWQKLTCHVRRWHTRQSTDKSHGHDNVHGEEWSATWRGGGKYKPYLLTHHASRRASTHAFHGICNHGNRMFIKRQCVVKKVRNVSVVTKLW